TTVNISGTMLQGIAVTSSGNLAVTDSGRNGILTINPRTTPSTVTTNTGFNGPGDQFGTKANAKFNQPYGIAAVPQGMLVVADYGNNRVKVVNSVGTVTNLYGVNSNFWVTGSGTYPGWWDGPVCRGDVTIAIAGTDGTETHYTFGPTTNANDIPDPSPTVGSTPPPYHDGLFPKDVPPSIVSPQPDVTIKAIGFQAGRSNSLVATARF